MPLTRTNVTKSLALALACIAMLGVQTPASAQMSKWDKDRLIEGLRKRGMAELLIHLSQTEKFDDPTDAARIQVEQLRIQATDPRLG